MRVLVCLALAAFAAIATLAEAQEDAALVTVRQSVQPAEAVIGQRVAVIVEVLFRDDMPAPPQVVLPEIPGVQVFRFESQATTVRDRLNGAPYVGQRFEFALFARRGGAFTVPPAVVTLLDHRREVVGSEPGQATPLTVRVPPGVDASQPVMATTRLALEQRWDPEPAATFKVGDALKRTVTRKVDDVPALAMQNLFGRTPDGVRAYVEAPEVDDRSNRGTLLGRRVDRVTYLFEKPGTFMLPAASQPWWDLGAQGLQNAEAEGARIEVMALPAAEAPQTRPGLMGLLPWPAYAVALGALVLAVWAARRFGSRTQSALNSWMTWRRQSEPAKFRRLRHACRGEHPGATYAALRLWRARLEEAAGACRAREAAIDVAAGRLEAVLFGGAPPGSWTGRDARHLIERMASLRSEALARPESSQRRRASLPPLNPARLPDTFAARGAAPLASRRLP